MSAPGRRSDRENDGCRDPGSASVRIVCDAEPIGEREKDMKAVVLDSKDGDSVILTGDGGIRRIRGRYKAGELLD